MPYAKKVSLLIVIVFVCFNATLSFALRSSLGNTVLPVTQVFKFSATRPESNKIIAEWQIAPGYYLYKQRIHFIVKPDVKTDIQFPASELKHEINQPGDYVEVYSGTLKIPLILPSSTPQAVQLSVDYQGCAAYGLCYPPVHTVVTLAANVSQPTISLSALLTDQNGVLALLQVQHYGVMLLIFACLGLLLAFTPCVLPMVPILAGIIIGHKKLVGTHHPAWLSITYVLGSALTYAVAGVVAALMGSTLQVWLQSPFFIFIGSTVFVLLALSLFGHYDLRLPRQWQNKLTHWSRHLCGGSYPGVFIMGIVSTLIISPCVTAPLVGVLMYIAHTGNIVFGASALFAMGLGMGVPLLLVGMSAGKFLPKSGPWMEAVKRFFGIIMLGVAIWLLSRVISAAMASILFSLLLLGAAVFFIWYLPRTVGLPLLNRILGVLLAVCAIALMINNFTTPAALTQQGGTNTVVQSTSHFVTVKNMEDLNKQLEKALHARKPVMLDFYADWCASCITMDKKVFQRPEVRCALDNFTLLRIDLSANSVTDELMLKALNVIAPPTVIFFDKQGKQVETQRIVGEVNAHQFLALLTQYTGVVCANN